MATKEQPYNWETIKKQLTIFESLFNDKKCKHSEAAIHNAVANYFEGLSKLAVHNTELCEHFDLEQINKLLRSKTSNEEET